MTNADIWHDVAHFPFTDGRTIHVSRYLTVDVYHDGIVLCSGSSGAQTLAVAPHEIKDLVEALATAAGLLAVNAARNNDTT